MANTAKRGDEKDENYETGATDNEEKANEQ
jgi:hypothetical protein